jgi:hypothetical protein
MQDFIARENIKRFSQELENTCNEQKKALLRQLLVEEQAKLRALESSQEHTHTPKQNPAANAAAVRHDSSPTPKFRKVRLGPLITAEALGGKAGCSVEHSPCWSWGMVTW